MLSNVLQKIVDYKRDEVAVARTTLPLPEVKARCADLPSTRGFEQALRLMHGSGGTAVIAEVKKGSPSKGLIRSDFDAVGIAETYAGSGAACISVLTDEKFFYGHLDYLRRVRQAVATPVIRKEFIIDQYQIYEAREAGADAILLIAAILDLPRIQEYSGIAAELGLDVLLEVHDEAETAVALEAGCTLIGINNRNLSTFVTDIATTERLLAAIPSDRLVVSESGINTREEIVRLQKSGAGAFLIGESLMREQDPGKKLRELLGKI